MPPVIPDPKKIKSFKNAAAFEKWMATHHDSESEIWLKIHKKSSGLPTVDYAQALDVALCWGWIDGIKKSFDEQKLDYVFVSYAGALHAFTNPEADKAAANGLNGVGYNAAADRRSWQHMRDFLAEVFATKS